MAEWRPLAPAVVGIEALWSSVLNEVSFGSSVFGEPARGPLYLQYLP
jgi:hypothetical protein